MSFSINYPFHHQQQTHRACDAPSPALGASRMLTHLTFTPTLCGRDPYYPPFTDEKMEALRVTNSPGKLQSWDSNPGNVALRLCFYTSHDIMPHCVQRRTWPRREREKLNQHPWGKRCVPRRPRGSILSLAFQALLHLSVFSLLVSAWCLTVQKPFPRRTRRPCQKSQLQRGRRGRDPGAAATTLLVLQLRSVCGSWGPEKIQGKEIGKKTNNRTWLADSIHKAIMISLSGPEKEFCIFRHTVRNMQCKHSVPTAQQCRYRARRWELPRTEDSDERGKARPSVCLGPEHLTPVSLSGRIQEKGSISPKFYIALEGHVY